MPFLEPKGGRIITRQTASFPPLRAKLYNVCAVCIAMQSRTVQQVLQDTWCLRQVQCLLKLCCSLWGNGSAAVASEASARAPATSDSQSQQNSKEMWGTPRPLPTKARSTILFVPFAMVQTGGHPLLVPLYSKAFYLD